MHATAPSSPETLSAIGIQIVERHPSLKQLKVLFVPQVSQLVKFIADRARFCSNLIAIAVNYRSDS